MMAWTRPIRTDPTVHKQLVLAKKIHPSAFKKTRKRVKIQLPIWDSGKEHVSKCLKIKCFTDT